MGRLTRAYDLRGVPVDAVTMLQDGETTSYFQEPLTRIPCPNLAEKRPSVQPADRVFAWRSDGGDGSMVQYEGFVLKVEADALLLGECDEVVKWLSAELGWTLPPPPPAAPAPCLIRRPR